MIKTVIDIIKIVGSILGVISVMVIVAYLFLMIPLWIFNSFGLFEKYGNCDVGMIYFFELLIIVGVIFIVSFIRKLYLENLEEIENEKAK